MEKQSSVTSLRLTGTDIDKLAEMCEKYDQNRNTVIRAAIDLASRGDIEESLVNVLVRGK